MNDQPEQKCIFETVTFSKWQRLKIWVSEIWRMVKTPPPKTWDKAVIIRQGDPRWNDKWAMGIDFARHSVRYSDRPNKIKKEPTP